MALAVNILLIYINVLIGHIVRRPRCGHPIFGHSDHGAGGSGGQTGTFCPNERFSVGAIDPPLHPEKWVCAAWKRRISDDPRPVGKRIAGRRAPVLGLEVREQPGIRGHRDADRDPAAGDGRRLLGSSLGSPMAP
ncbi:hypothetical protein [Paracoccus sp. DMF]|uniref:hypothetical protein n=1 Tax=Paracoccus sp. DMF TaxID=400837 RepID=UPI0021E4E9CD|nr:hypothetical protein [Paracoccus sp. DMF]MCV2448302.1 hypothetical protein [Paracoccus sp. DMF]